MNIRELNNGQKTKHNVLKPNIDRLYVVYTIHVISVLVTISCCMVGSVDPPPTTKQTVHVQRLKTGVHMHTLRTLQMY